MGKRLRSKIQGYSEVSPYTNTDTRLHDIAGDTFIENTELSLEKVENILITTAKCCLKITAGKTRKRIKSLSNKKWFDKECRLKRHELRKLANKKHQRPFEYYYT